MYSEELTLKSKEGFGYIDISDHKSVDTNMPSITTTSSAVTTTIETDGWVRNADGTKVTGWFKDVSAWYYLNKEGLMQTGWINDNGTWYYCNESGKCSMIIQLIDIY